MSLNLIFYVTGFTPKYMVKETMLLMLEPELYFHYNYAATAVGWLRATVPRVYNLSIVRGRSSREKRLLTIAKRYI